MTFNRIVKLSAECRMQNAECRMQNAECRMQSAECRVQSAECRVQNAECRVQSAECRVQSAECRVMVTFRGAKSNYYKNCFAIAKHTYCAAERQRSSTDRNIVLYKLRAPAPLGLKNKE